MYCIGISFLQKVKKSGLKKSVFQGHTPLHKTGFSEYCIFMFLQELGLQKSKKDYI